MIQLYIGLYLPWIFVHKCGADNLPYHISWLLLLAVERLCEDPLLFC